MSDAAYEQLRALSESLAECFKAIGEFLDYIEYTFFDVCQGDAGRIRASYRKALDRMMCWMEERERPHWQTLRLCPVRVSTRPLGYRAPRIMRWSPQYGRR